MRSEVDEGRRSRPTSLLGPSGRPAGDTLASVPEHEDSQAEWARQEQQVRFRVRMTERDRMATDERLDQMMMRQQDQTIDSIAGTLSTIHEQAGLMGREILEHNE